MYSSSRELKLTAKARIRARVFPILVTAALFIVADYVISWLSSELSGYNAYVRRIMEIVSSYSGELQTMTDPNALNAIIQRISQSMPSFTEFLSGRGMMGPVLSALVSLISVPLTVGYYYHCLSESRGTDTKPGSLMRGFRMTFKSLGIYLLTGILVALGALLFIVPGFILAARYSMAYFVMLDNPEKGVIECMRASGRIMRGHKWRYVVLLLSFILWLIAASLVTTLIGAPLLNIYVLPYMQLCQAGFYNELIGYKSVPDEALG